MLRTDDHGRVRLLTLDRPEALNAFNTALYDTVAGALNDAAVDGDIAVVVLTGDPVSEAERITRGWPDRGGKR